MNTDLIWKPVSASQQKTIELFKNTFILQKIEDISLFFSDDFDLHNGYIKEDYIQYEMEEFKLKCDHFGLRLDCAISSYSVGKNFIYFSLGKKDDCAVFEGMFRWDENSSKLKGNGYHFKIEPKIQFVHTKDGMHLKRRINITPPNDNKIKNIIVGANADNFQFIKSELASHLGGNFYSIVYDLEEETSLSFWDKIKIFTNNGVYSSSVLMRGTDHPLFIPDLLQSKSQYELSCPSNIYPVVLYILLENGEDVYFKYPQERNWKFEHKIQMACLTDTLSFDWILDFN